MNEKRSLDDLRKMFLWIVVTLILIFLIGYNLYSGLTVEKIGIPGIFMIEFGKKSVPEPSRPVSVEIPLSLGWKAEGPAAVGEGYKDGIMTLNISSHTEEYENNYAQLCLDLTHTRQFPELERNPDETYNLAKTEIIGIVRSNQNFRSDSDNLNLAYFTLFNKTDNLFGPQIDIADEMKSPAGMKMLFEVPNDKIYHDIRGICLTFAFSSNKIYNGSIDVLNVTINK